MNTRCSKCNHDLDPSQRQAGDILCHACEVEWWAQMKDVFQLRYEAWMKNNTAVG